MRLRIRYVYRQDPELVRLIRELEQVVANFWNMIVPITGVDEGAKRR